MGAAEGVAEGVAVRHRCGLSMRWRNLGREPRVIRPLNYRALAKISKADIGDIFREDW